jgi:hypothetical protein
MSDERKTPPLTIVFSQSKDVIPEPLFPDPGPPAPHTKPYAEIVQRADGQSFDDALNDFADSAVDDFFSPATHSLSPETPELTLLQPLDFPEPRVETIDKLDDDNRKTGSEVTISAPPPPAPKLHADSSPREILHDDIHRMNHLLSALQVSWKAPLNVNDVCKLALTTARVLETRRKLFLRAYRDQAVNDQDSSGPIDVTNHVMTSLD